MHVYIWLYQSQTQFHHLLFHLCLRFPLHFIFQIFIAAHMLYQQFTRLTRLLLHLSRSRALIATNSLRGMHLALQTMALTPLPISSKSLYSDAANGYIFFSARGSEENEAFLSITEFSSLGSRKSVMLLNTFYETMTNRVHFGL